MGQPRWDEVQRKQREVLTAALCKKDLEMLERLEGDMDLSEVERDAFDEMLRGLRGGQWQKLTDKQRAWANAVAVRIGAIGCANLVSSGQVSRGREVETPEVLRHLPMKPPGRR